MRPMLPAIYLFILFVVVSTCGCSTPVRSEPRVTVRSAKELEKHAIEESKKWRTDAFLTRVYIGAPTLDPPQDPMWSPEVSFDFHSWSDHLHSYTIDFHLDGRIVSREWPIFVYLFDYVPIEPTDWLIDSTDAWRIAWANGGKDFALKYPTAIQTALTMMERWDPPRSGTVLWYVAFLDAPQQHSLRIFIDAKTGEVAKKELR